VVVVEGAAVTHFTETTTMFAISLVLSVAGVGFCCWLLFTLAIYALPFFTGLTAAFAAYHSGCGILGAIIVAVMVGAATLGIGRMAITRTRSGVARLAIGLLYAAPAAIAGYEATLGLVQIGVPSAIWRQVFAICGSLAVGATAWVRMASYTPSVRTERGLAAGQSLRPPAAARPGG